MVPEGVVTPEALGAGQRCNRALGVGFRREGGITLPGNGVGAALLPGQAPWAFTLPAQGSTIAILMDEKSPARSLAVGTVAVKGCPVRSRKPSQLANQNLRFRPLKRAKCKGPPPWLPNSFFTPRGYTF